MITRSKVEDNAHDHVLTWFPPTGKSPPHHVFLRAIQKKCRHNLNYPHIKCIAQETNLINSPPEVVSLAKQRQQHHAILSTFTMLTL